jgi:hypothetical protein
MDKALEQVAVKEVVVESLPVKNSDHVKNDIDIALKLLPQLDQQLEHFFIDGVYVRSLKIPKGAGISGKFHTTDHISILAEGTLKVIIDNEPMTITAPYIAVTHKGDRKVGYAVTDCTFINVIRTDLTDLAKIESSVVCDTEEELLCHLPQH